MLSKLVNLDYVDDSNHAFAVVKEAMVHNSKIGELTHDLYKYPACFPPSFPRAALNSFSKEGDWVLDPFVGGGTTAVEALANKRNFIGSDLNDLAIFSSRFKTTLLTNKERNEIVDWLESSKLTLSKELHRESDELFFTNVPPHIEKFIRKSATAITSLKSAAANRFLLGSLLRLGQLEVETREQSSSFAKMEFAYKQLVLSHIQKEAMLNGVVGFDRDFVPTNKIFAGDASDLDIIAKWSPTGREFDVVLTSPPYPEKHILYNKWQVRGRAETRLPYWVIGSDSLESESHYTMGSRHDKNCLEIYITGMSAVFSNLNEVLKKNGLVIQVVAFTDLKRQLPLYLAAMNENGFVEVRNVDTSSFDGRLWRDVPNRKWFNRTSNTTCKEVVLFHRKSKNV